jgi:signal transduction histidine kinase
MKMGSLRGRFILSHILPLLLVTPFMGIALIYLLESQLILPNIATHLQRQANLIIEFTGNNPTLWHDPAQAQATVARFQPILSARLALLQADGTLLASGDPADAGAIGRRIQEIDLASAQTGESRVTTHYSTDLQADVADVLIPVVTDGRMVGMVRLSQPFSSTVQERFQRVRTFVIWVLAPGLLLGIGAALLLAGLLQRPLQAVTQGIGQMASRPTAAGDESSLVLLPEQGPDELRLLVRSFNQLRSNLHQVETERRQLLGNLLHELGRPLGALRSAIDALLNGATEDPRLRHSLLHGIDGEIQRLQRILNDLTLLYQEDIERQTLNRRPVRLHDWLILTLVHWRHHAEQKGIQWQEEVPANLPILSIDPDRLGQVLGNLLSNAVKFTPPGGAITVAVAAATDEVRLSIKDSGPGIPHHEQIHIFEPFYRGATRPARGMGIGLTIARDLAEAHNGDITVESSPGEGAIFTIHLPVG